MSKQIIILLHGYGSDGNDMRGLGEYWAHELPDIIYAAPDAHEVCEAGFGYQWFSLMSAAEQGLEVLLTSARNQIDQTLAKIFSDHAIDPNQDKVVLVGFSQGTMVALDLLLRNQFPNLILIGFSGRIASPQPWEVSAEARILLIHGAEDDVVPCEQSEWACLQLQSYGIACQYISQPGVEHTITVKGIDIATRFLKAQLLSETELGDKD